MLIVKIKTKKTEVYHKKANFKDLKICFVAAQNDNKIYHLEKKMYIILKEMMKNL